MERQISFIRSSRDDLHEKMMIWDDVIETWATLPVERTPDIEAKLRDLYRFLARHFIIEKQWQLTGDSFDRKPPHH